MIKIRIYEDKHISVAHAGLAQIVNEQRLLRADATLSRQTHTVYSRHRWFFALYGTRVDCRNCSQLFACTEW